ncbi:MAG TPA: protein translocase subunit SecF [Candidatus Dormibacteraeota bacterium]|nr:protein translocase subunit SecF [Candidatus Dormibacteraeota bacterium]
MEFFKSPNINWMGKAKYFAALSGLLLLIGLISWLHQGGLLYGIDFRGGTLVSLRFASTPPTSKLRAALAQQGLGDSTIQRNYDPSDPSSTNDVLIAMKETGGVSRRLDAGRAAILKALTALFPAPSGKQDFNAATPDGLAGFLTHQDPLQLGVSAAPRYQQLAQALLHYRDTDSGGIVKSIGDLGKAPGATPAVVASLEQGFYAGPYVIRDVQIVGPQVGSQLRRQAVLATLYALAGMLIYIAFRFEWVYGAAAVIAVFHDVLITLGFFCLFHYEISLTVIAALLTLVGYSMNDTIVIFDRVRENLRLMRRESFPEIVNRSINQTLSRTILTSSLTFLAVLVLFLLGGSVLRSFAFAMVVGVVVGTYSSFGIAAPIVVLWTRFRGEKTAGGAASGSGGRQPKHARAGERRLAAAGRR